MESSLTNSGFASILSGNKEKMAEITAYENKPVTATKRNLLFAGGTIVGLLILSLFVLQIIKGAIAFGVVAVVGVGAFFGLRFLKAADPLIRQKTKNYVLKQMVEEARKNAVIQLENQILTNRKRLEQGRDARNKMGGLVEKLKGKINPKNEGKPTYEKKVQMLERVQNAYNQICINMQKAKKADVAFAEKVAEYKDMDSFASIANEAMQMFSDSDNQGLEEMLSLAAFEHIEDEFNVALVEIENKTFDMTDED